MLVRIRKYGKRSNVHDNYRDGDLQHIKETIGYENYRKLVRASRTLQRWYEEECGMDNKYASYNIERDEQTDKPYRVVRPHNSNEVYYNVIADREKGALRTIHKICTDHNLHYYIQTDPRGTALYVSLDKPLTDSNYSSFGRGIYEYE